MKTVILYLVLALGLDVKGLTSFVSTRIHKNNSLSHRNPLIRKSTPTVQLSTTQIVSAAGTALDRLGFIPQAISYLHQDYMFVLSTLLFMSTFGIFLERKTTIGKSLSVC